MIKRVSIIIFSISFCFLATPIFASETNGTIDSAYKYAWGEGLGWINFAPKNNDTYFGLVITDTAITGYAWSPDFGWINFSPTTYGGVTNNTSGELGGYAWSTSKGWTNLTGIAISSSGKFTGTGTVSSDAGRITFDCNYCDVRTDWRPLSARVVISGGGGDWGGTISTPLTASISNNIVSANKPLEILPNQSGVSIIDTSVGKVILEIPSNAVFDKTIFSIIEELRTSQNININLSGATLINNTFYNIAAVDKDGQPVHSFALPLTLTLPLPRNLIEKKELAVYWLDETKNQWIKIPNTVFAKDSVIFTVTHLTRFAILSGAIETNGRAAIHKKLPPIMNAVNKKQAVSNQGIIQLQDHNATTTPTGNVTPTTLQNINNQARLIRITIFLIVLIPASIIYLIYLHKKK